MNVLSELLLICLLGTLHANILPEEKGLNRDEQRVERRYAESTIASKISKIMDSMVQKNFVDFLLNHREKKSKPATTVEDLYNDLLRLSLREQQRRHI